MPARLLHCSHHSEPTWRLREIEALENFWGVERDPSSPPQQQPLPQEAGNITQEEDVDVGVFLATILPPEPNGFRFPV